MCAFDTLIAAPQATLIDIPVLLLRAPGRVGAGRPAVGRGGRLRPPAHRARGQPEESRALVISNSWGSFSPRWDFPVGHPGNYSDNPAHPFNLIVASLEQAGADVLFAAGNCGRDCKDGRCAYPERPIAGANSHPGCCRIGGVDVDGKRVGYSSQGPGRLSDRKPDICAYTHFSGSKAFGDGRARLRHLGRLPGRRRASSPRSAPAGPPPGSPPPSCAPCSGAPPTTAATSGFDYDYGYGIINPPAVLAALRRLETRRA